MGAGHGLRYVIEEAISQRSLVPVVFAQGTYRLLFLRKAGTEYVYTDKHFGEFSASRIVSQAGVSGMELLEADLKAGLRDRDPNRVAANLELLLGYPHLKSTSGIADLLQLGDPQIDVFVYAILLKNHDFSHTSQMLAFADQIPDKAPLSFNTAPLGARISQIRDESQLPLLIAFSQSRNMFFRRRAVDALRAMRSPASVPALIERLGDPDSFVRHIAIKSLAEITGRDDPAHSPASPEFKKSEGKYIQLWRDWWDREGRFLYSGSKQR